MIDTTPCRDESPTGTQTGRARDIRSHGQYKPVLSRDTNSLNRGEGLECNVTFYRTLNRPLERYPTPSKGYQPPSQDYYSNYQHPTPPTTTTSSPSTTQPVIYHESEEPVALYRFSFTTEPSVQDSGESQLCSCQTVILLFRLRGLRDRLQ